MRRALPGNRRVGNLALAAPSSVLTRCDVERIVSRDLATPEHRLHGNSVRAVAMRDRRALIGELNDARAECATLRARLGQLQARG